MLRSFKTRTDRKIAFGPPRGVCRESEAESVCFSEAQSHKSGLGSQARARRPRRNSSNQPALVRLGGLFSRTRKTAAHLWKSRAVAAVPYWSWQA